MRKFLVGVALALVALSLNIVSVAAADGPCCYSIGAPAPGE